MLWVLILIALCGFSCESPEDPSTPEGALAMLAPCIDGANRRCLYDRLDRDSQWSVQTIHKTLVDIRKLVEASYPQARRPGAYGAWREEATAPDPAGVFDAYCLKKKCLALVARGFGAVVGKEKTGPQTVEVETTRGGVFEMSKAEGRWGLILFRDDLQRAKIRLLDRLKETRRNATAFEEQRRAGGVSGGDSVPTPNYNHVSP